MATIDVIIPTYERIDMTRQAVASVERQTFPDWRVIIVDDASKSETVAELHALTSDPRVTVVESPANAGPQSARQRGLEHSDAAYVALLDSDDRWMPRKLERQVAAIDGVDVVLCWHQWVRQGVPAKDVAQPSGSGSLSPTLTSNMSTPLIRRTALDAAGGMRPPGTPSLRTGEGVEFFVRLAKYATYRVVPELLVKCYNHTGPRSSSAHGTLSAAHDLSYVVRKHDEFLRRWPNDYAVLLARTSARYIAAGCLDKGLDLMRQAVNVASWGQRADLLRRFGPFTVKRLALSVLGR